MRLIMSNLWHTWLRVDVLLKYTRYVTNQDSEYPINLCRIKYLLPWETLSGRETGMNDIIEAS